MQVCSQHSSSDNMWWDASAAAAGGCSISKSCGRRMGCRNGDVPAAAGVFKGHAAVVQAAKARHAAHCLTCRDKLDCGTELFRPAKQQGRHVSGEWQLILD